jgi:hypothetical protein
MPGRSFMPNGPDRLKGIGEGMHRVNAVMLRLLGSSLAVACCLSCGGGQEPVVAPTPPAPPVAAPPPGAPMPGPPMSAHISTDAELFALVTQKEPFAAYGLFPNADEIASGTLVGSSAHRPLVRVSLNATALGALQNGKLVAGTKFPNGSAIVKDVRTSGGTTVAYAVIYKDSDNRSAGSGWLWAEFKPDGTLGYSIANQGAGCISCHSLERGLQNDLVRTFERQR